LITPDFERDRFEGQMNPPEREALYNLILQTKPNLVCEVGTARGGGSTYFISSALRNNEKGILHTCENNPEFYDYARSLYGGCQDMLGLDQYINFHFGDSEEIFTPLLRKINKPEIVFLDGGASSIKMVYDFTLFRPYMPVGSLLACHDWVNGKSCYLRPVIQNDCDWELVYQILEFVVFKRVSNIHSQNT
jgi:predicted O-methyltransferase YrrM